MSWKAMEVSMSKTRRGKYIDNRICHKGKCKGDMRFNLRGKGKIPCFSYLCEGNHFRFIEERYKKKRINSKISYEKVHKREKGSPKSMSEPLFIILRELLLLLSEMMITHPSPS